MILALIFEPVIANQHGVGVSAPLAHQHRAGLRYDAGSEGCTGFLELSGQGLQTAPLRPARAAFGSLLPLMSKGSDHQIATETRRWSGVMRLPPPRLGTTDGSPARWRAEALSIAGFIRLPGH